ncbi:hypothetical protein SDC9_127531 [bioreactor metagenome]|uniref:DNA helicase PriA n=1 Tax=bioreactor metagenome TaxID=1076179 RepID=A0A645CU94_9ZZZZ
MSSVKEYKCLSCKAGLEFHPPTQNWKCNYCFSEFTKEQLDDAYQQEESKTPEEDNLELDSYKCTSCGAELIADGTTSATFCLYCKSPTIIKSRFSGKFKPKNLIPFRLTQEEARDIYKEWIGKRRFVPDEFKGKREIDKITGIYAPFWLFDCHVEGVIDGEGTMVSSWSDGEYRYTNTKYYRVFRRGNAEYHKVPVDASKKLDDKFMHLIEPYNYEDLKDFSMQYMSGFMAEKRTVETDAMGEQLKEQVNKYATRLLDDSVSGYNIVDSKNVDIDMLDTKWDYVLLPVWVLTYISNGKIYYYALNGQTGKAVGELPVNKPKLILFAVIIFLVFFLIVVLIGGLLI